MEKIFRLVEMSFRDLLYVAAVAVYCRDKLLIQSLIPATEA